MHHFDRPFHFSFLPSERHHSISACFQSESNFAGGFALNASFYNPGENNLSYYWGFDEDLPIHQERLYSFTWGFGFQELGLQNHLFGLTAKFLTSSLPEPGNSGESDAHSSAIDFGFYWQISDLVSIGFTLTNMGEALFYIYEDHMHPLPFNGNLAIGFNKEFKISNIPIKTVAEYTIKGYFVRNYDNKKPDSFFKAIKTSWQNKSARENWNSILHSIGYEITIFDRLHLRQGFYIDNRYKENEMSYGIGESFLKHFDIDIYVICSPKTGYRHGAWGITFSAYRLWDWTNQDET